MKKNKRGQLLKMELSRESLQKILESNSIEKLPITELESLFFKEKQIVGHIPSGHWEIDPRNSDRIVYNASRRKRPHDNIKPEKDSEKNKEIKDCAICRGNTTGVLDVEELSDGFTFINKNLYPAVYPHENINDEMRIFSVRIGLNENVDNLVQDINGKLNVTGAGINMAQRIMGLADGNQILVSQSIYETFKYREKYMNKFRPYQATVKHNLKINVYQFVSDEFRGLNCDTPREFVLQDQKVARLNLFSAYYFAHSIKNKDILLRLNQISQDHNIAIVLLYFLAKDSEGLAKSNDVNPYSPKIFGGDRKTIEEQYNYYSSINYWVISEFASLVQNLLINYKNCFEKTDGLIFINKKGISKLKEEFPDIYEAFEIENNN